MIKSNLQRNIAGTFWRNRSGSVAMISGLLIVVLVLCVGAAIDYSVAHSKRQHMQWALDASILAAARMDNATVKERKEHGESVFLANYTGDSAVNYDLTVQADNIRATATSAAQTSFMKLANIDAIDIKATSEVPKLSKTIPAEIAVVLDYSTSMEDENRYIKMREAAIQMIDIITDGGMNRNVKFGLVPFADAVAVDLPDSHLSSPSTYTGCVTDRLHPWNIGELAGTGQDGAKWGSYEEKYCLGYQQERTVVAPLSADLDAIRVQLNRMVPVGATNLALGAAFGWQVLSPIGAFNQAEPYNKDKVVKVMVFLTDGMQTYKSHGPGDTRQDPGTVDAGVQNTKDICSNMKNKDIQIYTIGVRLITQRAVDILTHCATDDHYYDVDNVANEMEVAFQDIGKKVKEEILRLSR